MVNIDNNVVINQDEDEIFGRLLGGGMRYISFSREEPEGSGDYISLPIGTSFTGVTTEPLQQRQATDFTTKQPKFYNDGKPIIDIIATLQTDLRTDEDDTGIRGLTFSSGMRAALMQEIKRLGIKKFGIGTRITVTLTGFKPNPKGKPSKLFNVDLVPTQWEPPAERETAAVLSNAGYTEVGAPGAQQQWAPSAADQAYAQQPQNQAPSQVAQQQPVQQAAPQPPVQQAAPVHQPQPVQVAQGTPTAPTAPVVSFELVQKVDLLIKNGFDRSTAIQAVTTQAGGDEAFRIALDNEIPF